MKLAIKYIIALYLLGFLFTTIGALFKIQHYAHNKELLIAGTMLQSIAIILGIVKALAKK